MIDIEALTDEMGERCSHVFISQAVDDAEPGSVGLVVVGPEGTVLAVECGVSDAGEPVLVARTHEASGATRTPTWLVLDDQVMITA